MSRTSFWRVVYNVVVMPDHVMGIVHDDVESSLRRPASVLLSHGDAVGAKFSSGEVSNN